MNIRGPGKGPLWHFACSMVTESGEVSVLQNFCFAVFVVFGMLAWAEDFVPVEEAAAANMIGATHVAPIYFRQGELTLSREEKKALQAFITSARAKGNLEEVKVLAWADREYPMTEKAAQPIQVEMAQTRANNIRKFLNENLEVHSVGVFNMAERPTPSDEMLKTSDYKVKHAMEVTGVVPKPDETGVFQDLGKGSSALVFLKADLKAEKK